VRLIVALFIASFAFAASAERSSSHIPLHKQSVRETKKHRTNDLFKSYLELSSFRHKTLAQNVANVNTPGYKADEVGMPEGYDGLIGRGKTSRKITMAKTSSKHISGNKDSSGKFSSHKLKDPYEIKKNGNNVSMGQQMTKIAQNKNDYNVAVKGYATLNSLYGTVIGK
jgi:flagellar basal-body rod protein FlgB